MGFGKQNEQQDRIPRPERVDPTVWKEMELVCFAAMKVYGEGRKRLSQEKCKRGGGKPEKAKPRRQRKEQTIQKREWKAVSPDDMMRLNDVVHSPADNEIGPDWQIGIICGRKSYSDSESWGGHGERGVCVCVVEGEKVLHSHFSNLRKQNGGFS